jgi:Ser/Thr protein kinase RdoA (MazF antagonist)
MPVAIIDFDAAAPGYRIDDLGYAAWLWLDIGNKEVSPADQAKRTKHFANAYGGIDPERLVEAMLKRQAMAVRSAGQSGDAAMAAWARDCLAWTVGNFSALTG